MTTIELTLTLPDEVIEEARGAKLLSASAIEQLILKEIERRRNIKRLAASMDELAALDIAPLSPQEVEAEIEAARRNRHARRP
jgi:hypothetical protein